jgi:hypothetical protein
VKGSIAWEKRDAAGVPHEQERALDMLHAQSGVPIFGAFDNQLGRGIVEALNRLAPCWQPLGFLVEQTLDGLPVGNRHLVDARHVPPMRGFEGVLGGVGSIFGTVSASLENGRKWYMTYCVTCHGPAGGGDGPVSITGPLNRPFAGVLPLAVVAARSDGHVYTTIRYGRRRMPSYKRIPSADRWDIVNYVRYLTQPKGITQ